MYVFFQISVILTLSQLLMSQIAIQKLRLKNGSLTMKLKVGLFSLLEFIYFLFYILQYPSMFLKTQNGLK